MKSFSINVISKYQGKIKEKDYHYFICYFQGIKSESIYGKEIAEEDNDYEAIDTVVFMPADEDTALVEIPVVNDFIVEEKESFKLFLYLIDNDASIAVDNGDNDAGTDVFIYDDDSKETHAYYFFYHLCFV